MGSSERHDIIIDAQILATKKLDMFNKRIEAAGGKAMLKLQKELRKAERNMKALGLTAAKTKPRFGRFARGIALGNIAAKAFTATIDLARKGLIELGKSVFVAARIKALNRVFEFTGKRVGYTAIQLKEYKSQLIASGIAEKEALGALQRGVQARFDLNKVIDLGRIAQNAAFVAGVNSSEAHIALMDAILKQRPMLLKQFGILVNLVEVYSNGAKELGKQVEALTATEKRTLLYNKVVEQAQTIQGAYVEGMKEVGKRLTSLPRHYQAAQNALGQHFVPALGLGVDALEGFAKSVKLAFETLDQHSEGLIASFRKQATSSQALQKMATRYEELRDKAHKSESEHAELYKVFKRLRELFPDMVTDWENYNDVMGLNVKAVGDVLQVQKDALRAQIEWSLISMAEKFKEDTKAVKENAAEIEKLATKSIKIGTDSYWSLGGSIDITAAATARLQNKNIELTASISKAKELLVQYMMANGSADLVARAFGETTLWEVAALYKKEQAIRAANAALGEGGGPAIDPRAAAKAARARARAKILSEIDDIFFEQSLLGRTQYAQQSLTIDRDAAQKQIEIANNKYLNLAEKVAAIDAREAIRRDEQIVLTEEFNARILEAQSDVDLAIIRSEEERNRKHEELMREWLRRWSLATNAVEDVVGDMARTLVSNAGNMKKDFRKTMAAVGQSIVQNLAKRAVKAIASYIAAAAVQKTAMAAELLSVKALTLAYISLASAKAAASLGLSSAASISAAATTKSSLTGSLAFDNPINDAFARRSGRDFGANFMEALKETLSPPSFGREVANELTPTVQPEQLGVGGAGAISINFYGNVTDEDFVRQVIVPQIEAAVSDGRSDIVVDDGFLAGERDVSI